MFYSVTGMKRTEKNKPLPTIIEAKKEELLRFVSNEFRELAKKKLRIPVKLYQL